MTLKPMMMLGAFGLLFTACNEAPEANLASACTALFEGEEEGQALLQEIGATQESFCECYSAAASEGGDTFAATVLTVLNTVNAETTTSGEVDDVVKSIEAAIDADAAAYPFSRADVDAVGDLMEQTGERFETGQCAA